MREEYCEGDARGGDGTIPGLDVIVFSRTLAATVRPGFRIANDEPAAVVAGLKAQPGGDIWLFGGGALFRSLLDAGLVDTVEVAVMPVLLGAGIPLLPPGESAVSLVLADQKVLPASGIVALAYSVQGGSGPVPRNRSLKKAKSGGKKRASGGTR